MPCQKTSAVLLNRLTRIEVVKEFVRLDDLPLPELIRRAGAQHHVDAEILRVLIHNESNGGAQEWLYRFEPRVFAERAIKDKHHREDERRMLASSHGVGQILGYNAQPRCGIHWSRLYVPAENINCAAKIMRENLDANKTIRDPYARLWLAYKSYNGSGPDAEEYAHRAMRSLAARLFDRLQLQM